MPLIEDPDLADVLMNASDDDIGLLIDVITDNGNGRISLSTAVTRQLVAAKASGPDELARALIAEELSRFGGNSMMNFMRRGKGVQYAEIAADVMSHTGAPKTSGTDCAAMEMAVIGKIFEQSLRGMSEEDKSTLFKSMAVPYREGMSNASLLALMGASGMASYSLAALVASATMRSMVGRGVTLAAGSGALGRGLGVLVGPLGWALTGIWTAFDLSTPAYRVTVPCVIQIGYMRQKMLLASACPTCHSPLTPGGNFCGECGVRLLTNSAPVT